MLPLSIHSRVSVVSVPSREYVCVVRKEKSEVVRLAVAFAVATVAKDVMVGLATVLVDDMMRLFDCLIEGSGLYI